MSTLKAPDPPPAVHPGRIDTFDGFLDYLDGWGDSVQRAVWQNTLNTPRKAHMHAYMTTLMPDNLTAALDAGLTTGRFALQDTQNWFSTWVGNQNMRQPTDRAALTLIAHWIYHRTVSPLTCTVSPLTCTVSPLTCTVSPLTCTVSPLTCTVSPLTCTAR